MSRLEDFAMVDILRLAVKEYGANSEMQALKTPEEIVEWLGESEIPRLVERLDNGE